MIRRMAREDSSSGRPANATERYDVAVVGAGAAGLMAAIFASRAGARVVAYDGAPRIGAKILISGGGRCNVTHDVVRAEDFNGNRKAIAKVLRTFDVAQTIDFFAELGVKLKREETGKLFPVSDRARDIVDALLRAASKVDIRTNHRITDITQVDAANIILAAGGQSVPKTGSDGSGYAIARALGHSVTPVFPALVPLLLEKDHWLTTLSGTSVDAELRVKSPTGRILHRERGSMLFTHFGLSGPVVLDISRHWIASQPATLSANFLPHETFESLEAALLGANPQSTLASFFRRMLPDRLVRAGDTALSRLTREERRAAIHDVIDFPLPVTGNRGFNYAEVTAGGVPLTEVNVATMESRVRPRLYLCGEILDVDGKIGGYNFQWAWASGRLAGMSAAAER
jgi:predicted Rossmann fold flavoprotein